MSVWMPSTAWSRGKRSVSRQIQVIKRKRRKFVAPGKAAVAQMAERRPCKADVGNHILDVRHKQEDTGEDRPTTGATPAMEARRG